MKSKQLTHTFQRAWFCCLSALLLFSVSSCRSGEKKIAPEQTPSTLVVAYLPMWRMPYTPDWEKLTHVCLAFGYVQQDGELDRTEVNQHQQVIREAHDHGVNVLLSIGGGGSKNFSSALLHPEYRARLVENLSIAVKDLDLDGIDVDYEEWDGGQQGASETDLQRLEVLELFYKELREKLGSDKWITAAVNASWDNGGFGLYNCFNNTMHKYLDFVSLMIYDETGPWSKERTGPHSSWDFFEKAIEHWLTNRHLPKEKLVAGVPFYGYRFLQEGDATGAQGMGYRNILEQYPEENAHLKDNIGLLYYDGRPTIERKARYIQQHQLGGIMFWEITQNTTDPEKSLLVAIDHILRPKDKK